MIFKELIYSFYVLAYKSAYFKLRDAGLLKKPVWPKVRIPVFRFSVKEF